MADQKLLHQKKCPGCGQWSVWNLGLEDKCQHCNALLDADGVKRKARKEEEQQRQAQKFNLDLVEIYPTDKPFTVFYKRIIQAFQVTFVAILSFIIWLVTLAAG